MPVGTGSIAAVRFCTLTVNIVINSDSDSDSDFKNCLIKQKGWLKYPICLKVGLDQSGRPVEEHKHPPQQQMLLLLVFSLILFQRGLVGILRLHLQSADGVCRAQCRDSRPGWSTSAVENGAASVQIHAQCLLFLEICPLPVTEDGTFRILSLDQLVRFRVEGRQNGVGVEAAVQQTVQSRQFQPSTDNSRKGVDCKLFLHSLTMNELVNFYQF